MIYNVVRIEGPVQLERCQGLWSCLVVDGWINALITIIGIIVALFIYRNTLKKQNFNYTKSLFKNNHGVFYMNFRSLLTYSNGSPEEYEIMSKNFPEKNISHFTDYKSNHGVNHEIFIKKFSNEKIHMYEPVQEFFDTIEMKMLFMNRSVKGHFHNIFEDDLVMPTSEEEIKEIIRTEVSKCEILLNQIFKELKIQIPEHLKSEDYSKSKVKEIVEESKFN